MTYKNITVIGIGRLGLCFALCLEKAGYNVLGIDLSEKYIDQINAKTLLSFEPFVEQYLKGSKHFKANVSLQEGMTFSDICFIVVPTNTVPDIYAYDHTILSNLLVKINAMKVMNKHLVICSTIFPGYIKKTASSLIPDCLNTDISYNPEFIAQGDIIQGLRNPDLVLIGEGSKAAGDALEEIYRNLCINSPHIARISVASAEISKLAVNCFVTAKIAFANLIGDIADETAGANKEEILKTIGKDQRIGSKNLKPGYGFGGPCFPRDNLALGNYASLIGIEPFFFRTTDRVNEQHAEQMAKKLLEQNISEYVFKDVCYKENCSVPITENSQKLVVAKKVAEAGKKVTIIDTEQILSQVQQEYKDLFKYTICKGKRGST